MGYLFSKRGVFMIQSVCIFGDSVAKGVVFDAVKKKYRILKESFVNIMERQQNVSILNFARFGCTVPWGAKYSNVTKQS
jgi:hypothetical protein